MNRSASRARSADLLPDPEQGDLAINTSRSRALRPFFVGIDPFRQAGLQPRDDGAVGIREAVFVQRGQWHPAALLPLLASGSPWKQVTFQISSKTCLSG